MVASVTNLNNKMPGDSVRERLIEALNEQFQAIIIVGVREDKTISVWSSDGLDLLAVLGGVELAKADLIQRTKSLE